MHGTDRASRAMHPVQMHGTDRASRATSHRPCSTADLGTSRYAAMRMSMPIEALTSEYRMTEITSQTSMQELTRV
eukprot:3176268-Rhodomonas_salina.5